MRVLIHQQNQDLAKAWTASFDAAGATVTHVTDSASASRLLETSAFDVILLDLAIEHGSALSLADMAAFRHPQASVIFVSDTGAFSDGSIFNHAVNARAIVASSTPPADLVAMAQHYAGVPIPVREAHRSPIPG